MRHEEYRLVPSIAWSWHLKSKS